MCWRIFVAGKLQCESAEYFGAFVTTVTSQRLSIQSGAPLWLQFQCQVMTPPIRPQFGGLV